MLSRRRKTRTYPMKTPRNNTDIHIPVRSCIVCRARHNKADLIRIVRGEDGRARIDEKKVMQSRGAYICPEEGCITRARKMKAFGRYFKCSVSDEIYDELEGLYK